MGSPHLTSSARAALPGKLRAVGWHWHFPNPASPATARLLDCLLPLTCPQEAAIFFIRTYSNTFAQYLLINTYFFLEREHLCSGREALCSHLHIWCVLTQRRWQGQKQGEAVREQGKYLTLTRYHLDAGFHQPLLTRKRSQAAQQETAKFSPSGSCSKEDLRPVYGDELGKFAPSVTQGLASMPSVCSFRSTLHLCMAPS